MDTGFYEDAMAGAEIKESMLKTVREGKSGTAYAKQKKYRKVDFHFTLGGSKALYQRQILEQRKTGTWFVGPRTIFLLAAAVIAAMSIEIDGDLLLSIFLAVSVYIMMIFSMAGMWEGELSKHYIYLIPDSAFGKMFYSTVPIVIRQFIEGAIILTAGGILAGSSPMAMVSAIVAYAMIGASFTYSDVFIRRLFGRVHGKVLRVFFRLLLVFFIIVPSVALSALIIETTGIYPLAFLATSLVNLVLVSLFMLAGVGVFTNPEFD